MVEVKAQPYSSRIVLMLLLATAVVLARTVSLMLAPLLVDLAREFDTSVAVTGQLAAATFIAWGITAPLVLLNAIIFFTGVLISWNIDHRPKDFFVEEIIASKNYLLTIGHSLLSF